MDDRTLSNRKNITPRKMGSRIIDWLGGQGAGNLTIYMMFVFIIATLIVECLSG